MKDKMTFSWYLCSEASLRSTQISLKKIIGLQCSFFSLVFCYLGFRLITIERS